LGRQEIQHIAVFRLIRPTQIPFENIVEGVFMAYLFDKRFELPGMFRRHAPKGEHFNDAFRNGVIVLLKCIAQHVPSARRREWRFMFRRLAP
jgi:hypothetical protein